MSDREYNGEYERVFGLKFRQPTSDSFGLNDDSVFDHWSYVFFMFLGLVPFLGFLSSFITMTTSATSRNYNPFCMDEQYWKAGVIGMVLQGIVLLVCILLLL